MHPSNLALAKYLVWLNICLSPMQFDRSQTRLLGKYKKMSIFFSLFFNKFAFCVTLELIEQPTHRFDIKIIYHLNKNKNTGSNC